MSTDATAIDNNGRRHFLIGVGVVTAGAAVGKLYGQTIIEKLGGKSPREKKMGAASASFQPHAFVRISSDDQVTIIVGKSEMGQGVHTGLPMILADELDIDPRRVTQADLRQLFAGVNDQHDAARHQSQGFDILLDGLMK